MGQASELVDDGILNLSGCVSVGQVEQQRLQTLQFQRCECVTRYRVGGIACDIRGKLAQRESCTAAHGAVGGAPVAWHGGYRRRKQPVQATP